MVVVTAKPGATPSLFPSPLVSIIFFAYPRKAGLKPEVKMHYLKSILLLALSTLSSISTLSVVSAAPTGLGRDREPARPKNGLGRPNREPARPEKARPDKETFLKLGRDAQALNVLFKNLDPTAPCEDSLPFNLLELVTYSSLDPSRTRTFNCLGPLEVPSPRLALFRTSAVIASSSLSSSLGYELTTPLSIHRSPYRLETKPFFPPQVPLPDDTQRQRRTRRSH
ncbi:hypothetical protein NMY22_g19875 [Coprinellus aureogranulatus]|nr:hypothetical protein NMY22_g19875 [Coprinellus aureogranulatus]